MISFFSIRKETLGTIIHHSTSLDQYNKLSYIFRFFISYNGGVCTIREKNGIYLGQIKALTAKLTKLKYRRPLACLDGDIRFFRYLLLMIAGHNRKFYPNFYFFFRDG
jgi:hypothetical protein